MSGQLEGRAGIITGAAGGIGRSLAGRSWRRARASPCSTSTPRGRRARRPSWAGLGSASTSPTPAPSTRRWRRSKAELGQLDFLVNNAGIRHQAAFLDHGLDEWRRTLDVNLTGAFICSQAVIRRMQPGGRVVNIASIAGVLGLKNRIAYSTTKAGVIGMTKAMAFELGASGICVNAIGPGVIETSLTASYFEDEAFADADPRQCPARALGTDVRPARRRGLPLRPGCGVRRGQVLCVDGGWVAGKGY